MSGDWLDGEAIPDDAAITTVSFGDGGAEMAVDGHYVNIGLTATDDDQTHLIVSMQLHTVANTVATFVMQPEGALLLALSLTEFAVKAMTKEEQE